MLSRFFIKPTWRRLEWSREGDHQWGPFLYSRDTTYKPMAFIYTTVTDEEVPLPGNELRISGFGHTFKIAFPTIIKPTTIQVKAENWDEETIRRLGRDFYEESYNKEFGFSSHEGYFQCFYGPQSMDSRFEKRWSCFLPWREWCHVRHSLYDLEGNEVWRESKNVKIRDLMDAEEQCPSATFEFTDYDGETISVRSYISEREWRFGDRWCKWLGLFRKPRIRRSLNLEFSSEVGPEKGSWKGGIMGHSIDMLPGETPIAAFKRYCEKHNLTFKRRNDYV